MPVVFLWNVIVPFKSLRSHEWQLLSYSFESYTFSIEIVVRTFYAQHKIPRKFNVLSQNCKNLTIQFLPLKTLETESLVSLVGTNAGCKRNQGMKDRFKGSDGFWCLALLNDGTVVPRSRWHAFDTGRIQAEYG